MLWPATPVGADEGDDGVVRGGANAYADSMSFQVFNAGAALGWTFGRSTAEYRDITATAEGKSVDLGALGALLATPQCFGELPPLLDVDTLPPQTLADSAEEGSEMPVSAEVRMPMFADDLGPRVLVGTQRAAARPTPWSEGSTETVDQDFGFFRVEGATSVARTTFEDGIRKARAESAAERIVIYGVLGDQVIIHGARWTATAWSGAEERAEVAFEFDTALVPGDLPLQDGRWVSGNDLRGLERGVGRLESRIDAVLGGLGIDIGFPELADPPGGGGVAISPLSVTISNAPIGKDLVIPLLRTDLLEQYRETSVSEDCRRETFWTIIDALERALAGAGSIETLIGGATATTDDTDYSFRPFEDPPPATTATTTVTESDPAPPVDTPGFDPVDTYDGFDDGYGDDLYDDTYDSGALEFSDLGDDSGFALDSGADDFVDGEPVAYAEQAEGSGDLGGGSSGDGDEIASGASTSDSAGNAAAVTMAVLGVLGALALSFGDRFHQARRRRRIP